MDDLDKEININADNGIGVNYEAIRDFHKSFFVDAYVEAFIKTIKLIKQEVRMRAGDRGHEKDDAILKWQYERIYNIISFIGARGTGKTSVMYSFLAALEEGDTPAFTDFLANSVSGTICMPHESIDMEKCEFIALECIDASLLEDKEDIVECILAKMMELVRKKEEKKGDHWYWERNEGGKIARDEINKYFDKIYKSLANVKQKEEDDYGTNTREKLDRLSGSMNLSSEFAEFIPKYLDIMSDKDKEHRFLLISIDDLDMRANGYEILERLHRYFMIPGVLIYITADSNALETMSENYFVTRKMVRKFGINGEVSTGDTDNKASQKILAKQYIDKVLPISQRVYMPLLTIDKEIALTDNSVIQSANYPIKKTILLKIAHRTRVFFDGYGLKPHFYEPKDLRGLVNLCTFLNSMRKISQDARDDRLYRHNISSLLEDIYYRMSVSKLEYDERKEFIRISTINPERQIAEIIDYLDTKRVNHSYGELLRTIYEIGRKDKKRKGFIHCALALETVVLSDLYYLYEKEKRNELKEERLCTLKNCLSESIIGNWGRNMLPKLDVDKSEVYYANRVTWGYIGKVGFKETEDVHLEYREQGKEISEESLLDFVNNTSVVRHLELLYLLFSIKEDRNLKFYVEKSSDEDSFAVYRMGISECQMSFDALRFVLNCMKYEEILDHVEEKLVNILMEQCKDKDISRQELKDVIKSQSMRNDFDEWRNKYSLFALPVYSVDITYNTIKRVRRKCVEDYGEYITKDHIMDAYRNFLKDIRDYLEKENEFYKENNGDIDFVKPFTENPVVKWILKEPEKKQTQDETFINYFCDIIGNIAVRNYMLASNYALEEESDYMSI